MSISRLAVILMLVFSGFSAAIAQDKPKSGMSIYDGGFSTKKFFENEDNAPTTTVISQEEAEAKQAQESKEADDRKKARTGIATGNTKTPSPFDQEPIKPNNPDAPFSFIAMVDAIAKGDKEVARLYARQFVRYLDDLMFMVREITHLVGEEMIDEKAIDEEAWVGMEQYLAYEFAQAADATNSPFKITEEKALKKIVADSRGEAEIYYFFTLNSSWCRKMAPDIERLYRLTKNDKRLKMAVLTIGSQPKEWIESYKSYTGLTMPIFDGLAVAKQFRIGMVPVVVIVAPSTKTAYLRTGQQSFDSLYRFVKTVQGGGIELSREAQKLKTLKIGQEENKVVKDKATGAELIKRSDNKESGLSRF